MELPLQITFKNIPSSPPIENLINEKASKLDKFHERIMGCRVVLDSTQRRHHQGKLYDVRIDITIPGKEMAVTREENEDIYVAVRDAFDAVYRRLEEQRRRQRGVVKAHAETPSGRIVRIFPAEHYGFILTDDEREIYFHANSVINGDFRMLRVGTEVSFLEEQGKEGPQAMRVAVVRRQAAA